MSAPSPYRLSRLQAVQDRMARRLAADAARAARATHALQNQLNRVDDVLAATAPIASDAAAMPLAAGAQLRGQLAAIRERARLQLDAAIAVEVQSRMAYRRIDARGERIAARLRQALRSIVDAQETHEAEERRLARAPGREGERE